MTFRYVAYAVQTSIKKNHDDSDININLILFYISVVANRLNSYRLKKNRSGNHLAIFNSVEVQMDEELDLYYFELPSPIMNMDHDTGIEFISYNFESCCCKGPSWAQVSTAETTAGKLRSIYGDPIERPSVKNPYHYIVGCGVDDIKGLRIYLAGPECINLRDVKIGIMCPIPVDPCDLDSEIPINDADQDELFRQVVTLCRFGQMIPEQEVNDGADTSGPIKPEVQQVQQQQNEDQ
jgi:hypothetical protein